MARQNIDEKWKSDPRRTALMKRLGSARLADGMRVEINWLVLAHRGQPIPWKEFQFLDNAQDWIDCGLGELSDGFVRIAGADTYADFFAKQRENGKKPKKPRKPKPSQPKPDEAKVNQTEPNKPSSSFSSSSSVSGSNSSSDVANLGNSPRSPVAVYCSNWKSRNGKNPSIRGKEAGQLTKLAEDLGADRACQIIEIYFQMPDPFFLKRGFDVGTLVTSIAAIEQFESTGKVVTRKVVEQAEEMIDKAQGTNRRPRKKLEDLEAEREQMLLEASKKEGA